MKLPVALNPYILYILTVKFNQLQAYTHTRTSIHAHKVLTKYMWAFMCTPHTYAHAKKSVTYSELFLSSPFPTGTTMSCSLESCVVFFKFYSIQSCFDCTRSVEILWDFEKKLFNFHWRHLVWGHVESVLSKAGDVTCNAVHSLSVTSSVFLSNILEVPNVWITCVSWRVYQ